jgi:hypothetical protein
MQIYTLSISASNIFSFPNNPSTEAILEPNNLRMPPVKSVGLTPRLHDRNEEEIPKNIIPMDPVEDTGAG